LIDILDIVAFVIEMNKTVGKWGPGFEAVLETIVQFSEHVVADVIKSGPSIAFQCLPSTASVYDCLTLLGKDRFHRVVILDGAEMSNIVTQSAMARYLDNLSNTSEVVRTYLKNSLNDFHLGKIQRVISLNTTAKAVDAFNVIQRNRVTGVPVVDSNGAIVGNLSARDIRSLVGSPDKFDRLFDTLSEFLEGIQEDRLGNSHVHAHSAPTSPLSSGAFASRPNAPAPSAAPEVVNASWRVPTAFTVDWDDSTGSVLHQLVEKNIHRAYIVDEARRPVGVVTLTDIIRVFTEGKHENPSLHRGSLHAEFKA